MTGPGHYAEAERHIESANGYPPDSREVHIHIGLAQVHATLALAAATALNDAEGGLTGPDWSEWQDVAHRKPEVTP